MFTYWNSKASKEREAQIDRVNAQVRPGNKRPRLVIYHDANMLCATMSVSAATCRRCEHQASASLCPTAAGEVPVRAAAGDRADVEVRQRGDGEAAQPRRDAGEHGRRHPRVPGRP